MRSGTLPTNTSPVLIKPHLIFLELSPEVLLTCAKLETLKEYFMNFLFLVDGLFSYFTVQGHGIM